MGSAFQHTRTYRNELHKISCLSSRHILGILVHIHAKKQDLRLQFHINQSINQSSTINYIMHEAQLYLKFTRQVFLKLLSIGSRETKHINKPRLHSMQNTKNEEQHSHNLLAKASYSEPFILQVSVFILFVQVIPPNLNTATRMGAI